MTPFSLEGVEFSTLVQIYFAIISTAAILAATLPLLRNSILRYGKLNEQATVTKTPRSTDQLSSALRSITVPKRWFGHFYLWAVLWVIYLKMDLSTYLTALADPAWPTTGTSLWSFHGFLDRTLGLAMAPNGSVEAIAHRLSDSFGPLLPLRLYLMHVWRRLYETRTIERPSPTARMHAGHYLVGLSFYTIVPLALWIDALEHPERIVPSSEWSHLRWAVCGTALVLYAWGSYHQHQCHRILANLRPQQTPSPPLQAAPVSPKISSSNSRRHRVRQATATATATNSSPLPKDMHNNITDRDKNAVSGTTQSTYKVPQGDWFEYLVCPHYVAEMVIYLSLYLAASVSFNGSYGAVSLLAAWLWVVCNLGIVARETAAWYRLTFGDQWTSRDRPPSSSSTSSDSVPAQRRWILVPFIY